MIINKGTIALGILLGAAVGVLLAPDKGSKTRQKVKDEARNVKDKLSKDFKEVKEDVSKSAASGKETVKKEMKDFASKASFKTESVITFLEKQLAILKEKNKTLQKPV